MKKLLIKFFFPTPTKADSSVYFYNTPTVTSNINNDIALSSNYNIVHGRFLRHYNNILYGTTYCEDDICIIPGDFYNRNSTRFLSISINGDINCPLRFDSGVGVQTIPSFFFIKRRH